MTWKMLSIIEKKAILDIAVGGYQNYTNISLAYQLCITQNWLDDLYFLWTIGMKVNQQDVIFAIQNSNDDVLHKDILDLYGGNSRFQKTHRYIDNNFIVDFVNLELYRFDIITKLTEQHIPIILQEIANQSSVIEIAFWKDDYNRWLFEAPNFNEGIKPNRVTSTGRDNFGYDAIINKGFKWEEFNECVDALNINTAEYTFDFHGSQFTVYNGQWIKKYVK